MRSTTIIFTCLFACALPFLMHGCKKKDHDTLGHVFSISRDRMGECIHQGESLQFTFSSSKSLYGTEYYQWDFGDGASSTNQSPKHTYLSAGNYEVTLMVNGHPQNVARSFLVVYSGTGSAYTSSLAGARKWSGYRTTWYDDSTFFSDSMLTIDVLDAGTVRFSGLEMEIAGIDTVNQRINYSACSEQAILSFYYMGDSATYSYRRQTGKLSGITIDMHTN